MSLQKEIVVFVGPPGAGKGTLSQICTNQWGWRHLSTGALCRKHIAQGSEIGKQIDFAIKSGKLIPNGLMSAMFQEWLLEHLEGNTPIVLDGYPRTVEQAKDLHELLKTKLPQYTLKIIRLIISDQVVVDRLASRLVCSNKDCQTVYSTYEKSLSSKESNVCDKCGSPLERRIDDVAAAVVERLNIYHAHEKNLLNYFKQAGYRVYEINVERPLNQIIEDFKKVMNATTI